MSLIGILGGSFDPIHYGHLAVGEHVFRECALTQLQFIPCRLPPHRQKPQAGPEHRLEMTRLAIAGHPHWIVNDIDFQRPGPSYMLDTLRLLCKQQPSARWALILGMDAFSHFNEWYQWEKILTLAHLIIVNRPGYTPPAWSQALLQDAQIKTAKELTLFFAGKILIEDMTPCPISSTDIRRQAELPILQDYLPPTVLDYIHRHRLYLKT